MLATPNLFPQLMPRSIAISMYVIAGILFLFIISHYLYVKYNKHKTQKKVIKSDKFIQNKKSYANISIENDKRYEYSRNCKNCNKSLNFHVPPILFLMAQIPNFINGKEFNLTCPHCNYKMEL